MKKVLIIITTGFVSWGGLTTVIMNYYRSMNKKNLCFDFISSNKPDEALLNEIHENGSLYYQLSDRKKRPFLYMLTLYKQIKAKKYDIVHVHGNSATMAFDLFPCWIVGIKRRITHVHTTNNQHQIMHRLLLSVMKGLVTDRVAVSDNAGKYLYGCDSFTVLYNAIDVENFRYSSEKREYYRKKYNIKPEAFVMGSVGKLTEIKNHLFIVDIFFEILKSRPNSVLLIVGDGTERGNIENKIKRYKIEGKCHLVGMKTDINGFLSAMDVFAFPSLYEGFGLALLEAEASGLNCVCSEHIPNQVLVTSNCRAMSLSNQGKWVHAFLKEPHLTRDESSERAICSIKRNLLDINDQANTLRNYYFKK